MPLIIDIHNQRPEPFWGALKSRGVTGVFLKATEGATFRDSTSAGRARRARAAGLRVGYYHFARPSGGDAVQEAQNFISWVRNAGGIQRKDFRPVLDMESTSLPHANLAQWVKTFNLLVKSSLGIGPLFYSYPDFIARMRLSTPLGYGLWLASYGLNDGERYPYRVPAPWRRAVLHQYTSQGSIGSYRGDVNYYPALRVRGLLAHPVAGLV